MLLLLFRGSGASGPPPVLTIDTRYPTGRSSFDQSATGRASFTQGVAGRADGNQSVTGRMPNSQ